MKPSFCLAFFSACVAFGPLPAHSGPWQEMVMVDSDLADYDGDKCVLTGHVTVEHELGSLSAKQVVMLPPAGADKEKAANLQLRGDVVFSLSDGGTLHCAQADIDYQSLCGVFCGDSQNAYVSYTDERDAKPLIVKGRQMGLAVARASEKSHGACSKGQIREITIDGDVIIHYAADFSAQADHAVYQRAPAGGDAAAEAPGLSGILTMRMAAAGGCCQVTTPRGDCIKAQEIAIDTVHRQLTFRQSQGHLSAPGPQRQPVYFVADRVLWHELTHELCLHGHVLVRQAQLGTLNGEEVRITQRVVDGQKQLAAIETAGKAVFSYVNEDKNLDHSLACHGTIKIDHLKMEAWMFSPKNELGKVPAGEQIHFDDLKGDIFADKAFIKYELINGAAVPSKIILGGNVRILNTLTRHENGTTMALQYALADQVEYTPHTSEMLFKANSGRRVLFFDKGNNLQVSAPALKIIRGTHGANETVQGYGDVRFSFIEHELEQLRQRFSFEKFNAAIPPVK